MTDVVTKSAAQIAHEQRNADRKAQAAQAKVDRFLMHVARNNRAAEDAAALRASRREMNAEIHGFHQDAMAASAAKAKQDRIDAHTGRNLARAADAVVARADKAASRLTSDLVELAAREQDPVVANDILGFAARLPLAA